MMMLLLVRLTNGLPVKLYIFVNFRFGQTNMLSSKGSFVPLELMSTYCPDVFLFLQFMHNIDEAEGCSQEILFGKPSNLTLVK